MQKIKKILIGTHNKGKFKEISYLLPQKTKKFSPDYFKIKSPKETGKSFQENSLLKVKYFFKYSKMPSISDDSGLEVIALKKKPGIRSARWAKKYGSFKKAMKKILQLLSKKKNRKAIFVCSLSIKLNKKIIVSVVGKIKGQISKKLKGKNGFGYDPIFIPDGEALTFAQMSKKKKIKIDHRYIAFMKLKKKFKFL
jgi:XTP/dITP diphosphohydrolase